MELCPHRVKTEELSYPQYKTEGLGFRLPVANVSSLEHSLKITFNPRIWKVKASHKFSAGKIIKAGNIDGMNDCGDMVVKGMILVHS